MSLLDRIREVKFLLVATAVLIAVGSLVVSHFLVRDLEREERRTVGVWAEAMRQLSEADGSTDLSLVLSVIESNSTIPVVVLDEAGRVSVARNVEGDAARAAARWQREGRVIDIPPSRVCYGESLMLHRLGVYPYVQLLVVVLFVVVALFALLASKRAEQRRVWVGLSKETAHQLGTPISSLMAWVEVLRETYPDDTLLPEMARDVDRLQRIAERFSKIGSRPELAPENLNELLAAVVEYMQKRTPRGVAVVARLPRQPITASLSAPLIEWVVENLCKNAVDALAGRGSITVTALREGATAVVEVADTGAGIPRSRWRTVFTPGFTTKRRGWGLGLSLARRIVEEYHGGRIYVKSSEVGRGTTFRIELRS